MVSKIKSKLKIVHIKHEKKKKRISYMNITFFKVPNIEYHLFTISKRTSIIVMQKKEYKNNGNSRKQICTKRWMHAKKRVKANIKAMKIMHHY